MPKNRIDGFRQPTNRNQRPCFLRVSPRSRLHPPEEPAGIPPVSWSLRPKTPSPKAGRYPPCGTSPPKRFPRARPSDGSSQSVHRLTATISLIQAKAVMKSRARAFLHPRVRKLFPRLDSCPGTASQTTRFAFRKLLGDGGLSNATRAFYQHGSRTAASPFPLHKPYANLPLAHNTP